MFFFFCGRYLTFSPATVVTDLISVTGPLAVVIDEEIVWLMFFFFAGGGGGNFQNWPKLKCRFIRNAQSKNPNRQLNPC